MDRAQVTLFNHFHDSVIFSMQSTQCYHCPLFPVAQLDKGDQKTVTVRTEWQTKMQFSYEDTQICSRTFQFREFTNYTFWPTAEGTCSLVFVSAEDWDFMTPLYVLFGLMLGLGILGFIIQYIVTRAFFLRFSFYFRRDRNLAETYSFQDLGEPYSSSQTLNQDHIEQPKIRLRSLDTFRGLAIVLMIFVNYGGGGYWFFAHSAWNGLTVADIVFPFFIFIMGTSMAISFKKIHRGQISKLQMFGKVVTRTILLFLIGIFLNSQGCKGQLPHLRIPGVLQRFSVTYFVLGILEILFSHAPSPGVPYNPLEIAPEWRPSPLADVRKIIPHAFVVMGFLGFYVGITFGLNVPGCSTGYLGPGGIQDNSEHFNCTGGAAGYLDRLVFGPDHIYRFPTSRDLYNTTMPYDPEGLLGCCTSLFLCFLGLLAGKTLLIYNNWISVVKRFIFWGLITLGLGLLLCKASWEGGWMPINKNLWSISFVLVNAAGCFILLAFFYFVIDVISFWSGKPFYYPGTNSIFLYVSHEVFEDYFPVSWNVSDYHSSYLALNVWGTCFWIIVAFIMYRKKIFISL